MMNDWFWFWVGVFIGVFFTLYFTFAIQTGVYIKPCEKNLPRTQHCELTAKVSEAKDE